MQYRRARVKGGTYFFTLVTSKRRRILTKPESIVILREAFQKVKESHPFIIDAFVLLHDHLHCIWTLPENDFDYSLRWRLIKSDFTRNYNKHFVSEDRKVWQGRYWEHLIRDEMDFMNHVDYIHYNPVKHGLVDAPKDWEYSSFHRSVKRKEYDKDWGAFENMEFTGITGDE